MRLASITIRHFKRLNEVSITIPKTDPNRPGSADFVTLLGPNNAGKSSVLEALRLALPGSDIPKAAVDHFPNRDLSKGPIEVELEFDELTPQDEQEQGIRTHVHNGRYRIKKSWSGPGVRPEIYAYEPTLEIAGWSDTATIAELRSLGPGWEKELDDFGAYTGVTWGKKPNKEQKAQLTAFIIERNSPLVVHGAPTWQKNPGGFAAHVDSVLPKVIFVPAIRETRDEAEVSEKKSAARQIVEAMFSRRLANHKAVKAFTEAGEAVKQLFVEKHEVVREVEERITTKLARLIPLGAKLDFDPPDVTADLASKTYLEIVDGAVQTTPENQGHGAQRALILSLLELWVEDLVAQSTVEGASSTQMLLLFEEPEIYLHPQMERKMRDVLLQFARSGTAQVICTSHSPIFIDLADRHDGIVFVDRDGEKTCLRQRTEELFGTGSRAEERRRLRMLLDFDPSVNEAFFSTEVCLVEGDCEVASIEAIAAKLNTDGQMDRDTYLGLRRNVSIINCHGKWTIVAFQRVLNGFGIKYRVVHDKDNEGNSGANSAILEALGGDESRRLVHAPNFERQLFGEEWNDDKPWRAVSRISAAHSLSVDLLWFFTFVIGQDLAATLSPAPEEEAAPTAERMQSPRDGGSPTGRVNP